MSPKASTPTAAGRSAWCATSSQGRDRATSRLFYYAGHGMQVGGENYLVPVDAKIAGAERPAFEAARARPVLAGLEGGPAPTS